MKTKRETVLDHLCGYIISFAVQYMMLFEIIYSEILTEKFFMKKYKEGGYQIAKKLKVSEKTFSVIIKDMISYCKKESASGKVDFFNPKEISHLQDIYRMLQWNKWLVIVLAISVMCLLIILKHNRSLKIIPGIFLKSEIVVLGIILLLGLIAFVDMKTFINKTHLIIFTNNLWIMNPVTDKIVYFFPMKFFGQILKYLLLRVLFQWGILTAIAILVEKWSR